MHFTNSVKYGVCRLKVSSIITSLVCNVFEMDSQCMVTGVGVGRGLRFRRVTEREYDQVSDGHSPSDYSRTEQGTQKFVIITA